MVPKYPGYAEVFNSVFVKAESNVILKIIMSRVINPTKNKCVNPTFLVHCLTPRHCSI